MAKTRLPYAADFHRQDGGTGACWPYARMGVLIIITDADPLWPAAPTTRRAPVTHDADWYMRTLYCASYLLHSYVGNGLSKNMARTSEAVGGASGDRRCVHPRRAIAARDN